jgi:hypothetical protein
VSWRDFIDEIERGGFSDWSVEQAKILERTPRLRTLVGI